MLLLRNLKPAISYLCGFEDAPPPGWRLSLASPWWGLWWTVLLALVILFCGQSSKFIYIDF